MGLSPGPGYPRRTPQNSGNIAGTVSLMSERNAVGQPNHALLPLPRNAKLPPGLATVSPSKAVMKALQPPSSAGH